MGRKFPSENNTSLLGPFLYFSFSMVGLVTSIAIITVLCSGKLKRKSCQSQSTTKSNLDSQKQEHPCTQEEAALDETTTNEINDTFIKELPSSPVLKQPDVGSRAVKKAASERRLSLNMSFKMRRSLSVARNWNQKEEKYEGKKMKLKTTNESVWMKTIILGGKCVPDEEENAIIYEGKGKKISAYHPRKSTSTALSRQWSQIPSDDALSIPQPHEEVINNNLTLQSNPI